MLWLFGSEEDIDGEGKVQTQTKTKYSRKPVETSDLRTKAIFGTPYEGLINLPQRIKALWFTFKSFHNDKLMPIYLDVSVSINQIQINTKFLITVRSHCALTIWKKFSFALLLNNDIYHYSLEE